MRPPRLASLSPMVTRRALATRLAAGVAAVGLGATRATADAARPDPVLRDAMLRGLSLADRRGDPAGAAAARSALDRLAASDPEGALLCRIYRRLDDRPSASWCLDSPDAAEADLATLHASIDDCAPVRFGYTDLSERQSVRTVLPLALVHPPQGVKLLAWCQEASGYRQFFVRAMRDLTRQPGDFTQERLTLLQGLLDKEDA